MIIKRLGIVLLAALIGMLAGCRVDAQNAADLRVRVVVDGKELVFQASGRVTVGQFLQQTDIRLGELDRVNPPEFSPITDNMLITIVRVRDDVVCNDEVVPYETQYLASPDLPSGTTKILQAGSNGTQRVCADVIFEDGVEKSRTPGNPTITSQPSAEIIARGVDKTKIEPITINGLLAYIIEGQARVIDGNSLNDRALPTGGNLDGHVFALSPGGRQLLFTRKSDGTPTPENYNELWVLLDTSDPAATPVRLTALDNVLTADWVPGQPYTFSYSTLQPREQAPGYQALNDLNIARIDSRTGKVVKATPVVKSRPTGVYSLWGTVFRWSPDGKSLAWGQADGAGLVDLKAGVYKKLFDFRVYSTTLSRNWVWLPDLTWSATSDLLAATIHGKPLGSEPEETSPVFNVALTQAKDQAAGLFSVDLVPQAGMWAAPEFSPLLDSTSDYQQGYIAYLKARNPIDSVSSEYDLVVADRDGSNARIVFPGKDKPGIKPLDNLFGNEISWSPDGRQVALIYQGDMWLIEVESGRANQVTVVGKAHHVRWVR
ncbi:MAG: G5 domain-containing protein [Chloroflexota bacterium]